MSNTILTPTAVTRKALQILHQKLVFIRRVNRQYDDSFAKTGAKIGSQLKIRLPNQYTVTTGATLVAQDTAETSTTLTVATQKHVGIKFTSQDLTLSLDDFAARILEPAMAVLAANVESDAFAMVKDVYNMAQVATAANALDFKTLLNGRKLMNDFLAPLDDERCAILSTQNTVDLVDALKALFQDSTAIKEQYREAMMGRTAGFDFYESTHLNTFTCGTETGGTMTVNGANQTGASITVTNGSSKTLKQGDIVQFVGTNAVHPETKADLGYKQSFVVTADVATSGTSIPISPSIVTSGATQNVTASPTDAQTIVHKGGASKVEMQSLLFHKNAFTFATADLVMPDGVDFARRETYDGISLRLVRQYDINNDQFPCRIDILYGYKTIRPQLACRLFSNEV